EVHLTPVELAPLTCGAWLTGLFPPLAWPLVPMLLIAASSGSVVRKRSGGFDKGGGSCACPRSDRSFDRCIPAARVPRIPVHGTRKTCASLLAALDVHPRIAVRIPRHCKIAITLRSTRRHPRPRPATRSAS